MPEELDVLENPELYPCRVVLQHLIANRFLLNDVLKLAIMAEHLLGQHGSIYETNCPLRYFYILLRARMHGVDV
jgi:hypothetical protein